MSERTHANDAGRDADGASGDDGYVRAEGIRLHYRADGPRDAPAVIFSNSLGMDLRMWDPQVPAFARRFHVIRYDSRGHGRSDVPPGPYTLDMLGTDLLMLLDALSIERAHVCGLSLGGMVAQWVAARRPERVMRAIFANTAARIGTRTTWVERIRVVQEGGMGAIRDAALARFLSAPFRDRQPEVAGWLADILTATPPEGYIASCEALRDADLHSVVTGIQAPSLVVAGALDESTPPTQARELQALVAGSELLVIDDAAHLSNVERADVFNASALEFLSRK